MHRQVGTQVYSGGVLLLIFWGKKGGKSEGRKVESKGEREGEGIHFLSLSKEITMLNSRLLYIEHTFQP